MSLWNIHSVGDKLELLEKDYQLVLIPAIPIMLKNILFVMNREKYYLPLNGVVALSELRSSFSMQKISLLQGFEVLWGL